MLPLSQEAMMFHGDTAYHDYEGISDDTAESVRLRRIWATSTRLF